MTLIDQFCRGKQTDKQTVFLHAHNVQEYGIYINARNIWMVDARALFLIT